MYFLRHLDPPTHRKHLTTLYVDLLINAPSIKSTNLVPFSFFWQHLCS